MKSHVDFRSRKQKHRTDTVTQSISFQRDAYVKLYELSFDTGLNLSQIVNMLILMTSGQQLMRLALDSDRPAA